MKGDPATDPKGLIEDAFRIEGISEPECRSIFLDWALSLPEATSTSDALKVLIGRFESAGSSHPMTAILRDGLQREGQKPQRRGGRSGRLNG